MKSFVSGAFLGAIVSGVAVALSTPKSGKHLRKDLQEGAEGAYEKGKYTIEKNYEDSKVKTDEIKTKANGYAEEKKELINQKIESLRKNKEQEKSKDVELNEEETNK